MQQLPHTYSVKVTAQNENLLTISAGNLSPLTVAPPLQFDGPGDQWSPEELLMASLSSCLVLSFRAIAKASQFEWLSIECHSSGELEKIERQVQFTRTSTQATLTIPAHGDAAKAEKILEKAEQSCFISNSLKGESALSCTIIKA